MCESHQLTMLAKMGVVGVVGDAEGDEEVD